MVRIQRPSRWGRLMKPRDLDRSDLFLAATLTVVSLLLRFHDLGRWGFATDEYYLSQSVSFILERGLPSFSTGGFYVRGIGLQYIMAVPMALLENRELAARLVPAICGSLTVPVLYVVARKFMGRTPAVICAATLMFSSWQIEISRFARMYAPFQLLFLAFFATYYRGFWEDNARCRKWTWAIAFLSILVYEGSVFMPLLLGLTLFRAPDVLSRRNVRLGFGVALLLAANLVAHKVDYRNLHVTEMIPPHLLPNEVESGTAIPFLDALASPLLTTPWGIGLCVLLLLFATYLWREFFLVKDPASWFTGLLVVVMPLLQGIGALVLILMVLGLFREAIRRRLTQSGLRLAGYLTFYVGFWTVIELAWNGLESGGWIGAGRRVFVALFLNIPLHEKLVYPYLRVVPLWSLLVGSLFAAALLRWICRRTTTAETSLLAVLFSSLLLVCMIPTLYAATRYSYFLLPLLLLSAALVLVAASRWLMSIPGRVPRYAGAVVALLTIAATIGTEDFNLSHLLNPAQPQAQFRTGPYASFSGHWYGRVDVQSPADYVKVNRAPGDVVVAETVAVRAYLEEPYAVFVRSGGSRYLGVARARGTRELWTGNRLISDLDQLTREIPENPQAQLWLVARTDLESHTFHAPDVLGALEQQGFVVRRRYEGIDGRVKVFTIARRVSGSTNES